MKAGVYYGPGDIRVEDIKNPKAGDDGMVMRVGACGICPVIDIPHYKMSFPLVDIPPHYREDSEISSSSIVLGHEFSGEVVEIGKNVTAVKVGDNVYGIIWVPCGRCEACQAGNHADCLFVDGGGRAANGAMAEYVLFPNLTYPSVVDDKLIKLPGNISYRDGAMIEPMRLGLGLANKAKKGDVAVILGQELIGLTALARLKETGVEKVITADVSKKRVQISQEIGADIAVHTLNEDIFEVVMNMTRNQGADIIIDVSCRPESLQQAVSLARPFGDIWLGTFYTAGAFFNPSWQGPGMVSMNLTQKPGLSIHCAWGTLGPWMPNLQKAVEMIQTGTITADKCVTHVFPLERIKEAFEIAMDPHESIKVMIEP